MASISNIFIDQGATFTTTVTVTDANDSAVKFIWIFSSSTNQKKSSID